MKIKTTRTFLSVGRLIKAGTVLAVPAEIDQATAEGWLRANLAEVVKEKKKGPQKTRVQRPKANRSK